MACVSLDCAAKQRVRYLLPQPVCEAFLGFFDGCEVSVNRFSETVRGAKDCFAIHRHGQVAAGGVLGDRSVVATYGKLGNRGGDPPARAAFEAALERYCGCEVYELPRATDSNAPSAPP